MADPGYQLARAAIGAGLPVTAAPGPSAVLVALTLSGLPSDRFLFAGFPPAQSAARRRWIEELDAAKATIIVFESPRRIHRTLEEFCEAMGEDRAAALCRELTKRFEEVRRGSLAELRDLAAEAPPKGECVLVVGRAPAIRATEAGVEDALRTALATKSVKAAVAAVAEETGLPRREVYQLALRLRDRGETGGAEEDGEDSPNLR